MNTTPDQLKNNARQWFSAEELTALQTPSALRSGLAITVNWLAIIAAFALVTTYPNVLTVLLAIVIIGTRMLALAIIMHEAAHQTLVGTRWLNDVLGNWCGAYWIFQNTGMYRQHHFKHHIRTGTAHDPDLRLCEHYPISRQRLLSNIRRDLTGLVGLKGLLGSILMLAGVIQYTVAGGKVGRINQDKSILQRIGIASLGLYGPIITNGVLIALLSYFASAWYYLIWLAAYMTIYMFVLRIRAAAEHALTDDPMDALNNARTTYTNPITRFFFAPLYVNYHLEHHMLMAVPFYQLPRMHKLLKARGAYAQSAAHEPSYGAVMRKLTRA